MLGEKTQCYVMIPRHNNGSVLIVTIRVLLIFFAHHY